LRSPGSLWPDEDADVVDLLPTATTKDERERASRIAVLPVGSFEQHGDYLPLITDTIVACAIAGEVAAAYNLMLLPPITISCSHEHATWSGTVSISAKTLHQVVNDIAESAARNGADKLFIVNGHGGNYVLSNIVQEANIAGPRMALFPARDDWEEAREVAGLETTNHDDMHGGELEVSILLNVDAELVDDRVRGQDHDAPRRPLLLLEGMRGYTESGIIGRPSLASAEKGKAILDFLTRAAAAHLDVMQGA
jgi:creatinine amidohydrolase